MDDARWAEFNHRRAVRREEAARLTKMCIRDRYQAQRRGGRGITALSRKDEDFVEELFLASTHDYIPVSYTHLDVYKRQP